MSKFTLNLANKFTLYQKLRKEIYLNLDKELKANQMWFQENIFGEVAIMSSSFTGLIYNIETKKASKNALLYKEDYKKYNEFKAKLISLGFEVKED